SGEGIGPWTEYIRHLQKSYPLSGTSENFVESRGAAVQPRGVRQTHLVAHQEREQGRREKKSI
ncbi:hypothetical protein, partial [Okeania sp. SIO2B9]|uniref:hypothetical protein n=1 Tax=Okeania sp. SIO2B9 TaxID=2607782 RepID=UPI00257BB147